MPAPVEPLSPREVPPTLSVLIAYYKGADMICAAVESALAQTFAPHEIVVCDDGSPDDLEAALGPLCSEVLIVRKSNGGTGSALNAALAASSGEYVVQLDQDDAFLPRRLEAIAAILGARPDLDLLATDAIIELDGTPVSTFGALNPFPQTDERMAILRRCTITWPAVRRSRLVASGGWGEHFSGAEDWDCALRLVLGGAVTAFVHEPLYRWRLTPGSRSSSGRERQCRDQVRMTEDVLSGPDLDPDERPFAEALLAQRRRALVREQARQAVATLAPDARRRSLGLVRGRGFDRATRAKAAIAVLSPRLASRFIARRREHPDPAVRALLDRSFDAGDLGELAR